MSPNPRHSIAALVALVVALWAAPANASLFTVDWDVVPHDDQELAFDVSPYYECTGVSYTARLCQSLWDTGLTLEATFFSFYDDKWFDGVGYGDTTFTDPVQRIRPECKPGLTPCFDVFSPLTLTISGHSNGLEAPLPNLFVASSKGGLVLAPSAGYLTSLDFTGSAWQDIEWLDVGFYLPGICDGEEPPDDPDVCDTSTEKALVIEDLEFEAVPEPALVSLLAAGALAFAVRRRRA
jgi:hypothetical protein